MHATENGFRYDPADICGAPFDKQNMIPAKHAKDPAYQFFINYIRFVK